ncbi:MAG: hypothetical protein LBH96_04005 [Candidatus Peribacteria bacterium]|jgi:hypothetical protein|nr:hypothetical protein [Candidatus Peribacteria bacterium]
MKIEGELDFDTDNWISDATITAMTGYYVRLNAGGYWSAYNSENIDVFIPMI